MLFIVISLTAILTQMYFNYRYDSYREPAVDYDYR